MTETTFDELLAEARQLRDDHVRGRYAPSPTGSLHLGNLRTALYAWLQVRLRDGTFVMRMEDVDEPRVVDGSAREILDDLRWLGLDWDEGPEIGGPLGPYNQSERTELYEEALRRLQDQDLIFRCYCSRSDVREAAGSDAEAAGGGVVYPGTCRDMTSEQEQQVRAEKPDRTPIYRFIVPDAEISLDDVVAGPYGEHLSEDVGDFIFRRTNEYFSYQAAVVVDDILMGMTDVVRGADLLTSTPRQIALYEALGVQPPRFWHVPLMVDDDGDTLSKRDGSDSLRLFRDELGWDAPRVIGHMAATLGWVEQGRRLSADELLEELDYQDLKAPPKASPAAAELK